MTAPADVLIVDDKPENLSLLSSMLGERGYEVRAAIRGSMALLAAADSPPDLVLLDIDMPEMDGYEVCRRLKADPRTADVPVIFLSAMDAIDDKVAAFEAGGVDYITKPFEVHEVLARVGTHVTLHRQRRELERQRRELEERYLQIQRVHTELRDYLSDRAWDSIRSRALAGGPALPAREVLTMLVSDIAGFVELSEREDPGPLVADLGLYMAALTQVVYAEGGEVDKYLGDGMLAFFKDAAAALRAAHRIQHAVARFDAQRRERGLAGLPTRIGLATGPVLFASIGAHGRREFTIIGDRVNVAFRLQAEAPRGGILMDAATRDAAGGAPGAVAAVVPIKGKQEPERVWVIGPGAIEPPGDDSNT